VSIPAQRDAANKQCAKCNCEHCDGRIEFDASDFDEGEMRTAECPHCHLETPLFVPRAEIAKSKRNWKVELTWQKIAAIILTIALVVLAVCFRHILKKLVAGLAEGFVGIVIIGAIGLTVYILSAKKLWLRFFSIVLFCCGSGLSLFGLALFVFASLKAGSTIFQEYEAIFLGLGGLVIISLSLILTALIALMKREAK
jgi:hypothetical protein